MPNHALLRALWILLMAGALFALVGVDECGDSIDDEEEEIPDTGPDNPDQGPQDPAPQPHPPN